MIREVFFKGKNIFYFFFKKFLDFFYFHENFKHSQNLLYNWRVFKILSESNRTLDFGQPRFDNKIMRKKITKPTKPNWLAIPFRLTWPLSEQQSTPPTSHMAVPLRCWHRLRRLRPLVSFPSDWGEERKPRERGREGETLEGDDIWPRSVQDHEIIVVAAPRKVWRLRSVSMWWPRTRSLARERFPLLAFSSGKWWRMFKLAFGCCCLKGGVKC